MGRLTALQKPNGGVRGIVAGDVFRRLVARFIAQQFGPAIERATSPFQYALSTREGTECIAHAIQALTDLDPSATVLSIDGIGAFDLVSHQAMLQGLLRVAGAPSSYLWEDQDGVVHTITQAEGGEQGDPLMPALFSLGAHPALQALQAQLQQDERLFAFLDDVYVVCSPDRINAIFSLLQNALFIHSAIRDHHGKTQVWNRGGVVPTGIEVMEAVARITDPEAIVWRGDTVLPSEDQGVRILGTPLGHPDYVRAQLQSLSATHDAKVPTLPDLQCAWMVLLHCCAARANYTLRLCTQS